MTGFEITRSQPQSCSVHFIVIVFGKKTLCLRQNSYQQRPSLTYWLY